MVGSSTRSCTSRARARLKEMSRSGGQLTKLNAFDGGLLHVGNAGLPLGIAACLTQQAEPVGKYLETGRIFYVAKWYANASYTVTCQAGSATGCWPARRQA
jgi:hypothetical protein